MHKQQIVTREVHILAINCYKGGTTREKQVQAVIFYKGNSIVL